MVVAYAKRLRFWTSIGSKKWFWTQNAKMFDAPLLCEPNFWILPGNNIYSMRSADWVQLRAMYAVLSDVQFWTAISSVDNLRPQLLPLVTARTIHQVHDGCEKLLVLVGRTPGKGQIQGLLRLAVAEESRGDLQTLCCLMVSTGNAPGIWKVVCIHERYLPACIDCILSAQALVETR
jgi:hypothetical protein